MSLESLRRDQQNTERDISNCEARIGVINGQADELKIIHGDLKNAKRDMKQYRTRMRNFSQERYTLWAGSLYNNYREYMLGENQTNCQTVVNKIDENMALVNNKRTELLNQLDIQRGLLGRLRAGLRSIVTAITNWVD